MACRLNGAKPLSEPMLSENAFENVVCEIASICLGLNVLTTIDRVSMMAYNSLQVKFVKTQYHIHIQGCAISVLINSMMIRYFVCCKLI